MYTKPDTLISNAFNSQNLNRYMFEQGNPYGKTDATGHMVEVQYEKDDNGDYIRVVYLNKVRYGTIVDGSETVQIYYMPDSVTSDGVSIKGHYNYHYDYLVQPDQLLAGGYMSPQMSLNSITIKDQKNIFRYENKENFMNVASIISGGLSKISKYIRYGSRAYAAGSTGWHFSQNDRVGVAGDILSLNIFSNTLFNAVDIMIPNKDGRKAGDRHARRTSGGGVGPNGFDYAIDDWLDYLDFQLEKEGRNIQDFMDLP